MLIGKVTILRFSLVLNFYENEKLPSEIEGIQVKSLKTKLVHFIIEWYSD